MTSIIRALWVGFAGLSILWLAADPGFFSATGIFQWRHFLVQYSGVLAMGCMSIAMILSLRPRWPERWFGGLDKMYRLHKWLGIGALVVSISHWFFVNGVKWAVGWGFLTKPERGPRAPIENPLEAFFRQLRNPAEFVGEWTFYAVALLIAVALIKIIPYRQFLRLHRVLPVAYLVLVFHSVVLAEFYYWLTPLGMVLAIMMAAGTYAAIISLMGRIGAERCVQGTIADLHSFPGVKVLRTTIDMGPGWPGHKAGQFAFATSNPKEGAHPYTIASSWDADAPQITFFTKALGDHTSRLEQTLKSGLPITIEGPYGCFTFDDDQPVQIWIGAGVGITPFIAKMQHLAKDGAAATKTIHLFHSTAEVDDAALQNLDEEARAANIQLHVLISARDGYLTGDRIRQAVPEWPEASFWFCGPAGFGAALRTDFANRGVPVRKRFHQELFSMR